MNAEEKKQMKIKKKLKQVKRKRKKEKRAETPPKEISNIHDILTCSFLHKKPNKKAIATALEYSCFSGKVNKAKLHMVLSSLEKVDAK